MGHYPCLCSGPAVTSVLCERVLFVLLALFWKRFRPTTPQTATNDVGQLSRKTNSRENNQSQDDSVTTDRRRLPASFSRPVASRVRFWFRTSAGLLFDTQSAQMEGEGAAAQLDTTQHWLRRVKECRDRPQTCRLSAARGLFVFGSWVRALAP